MDHCARPELSGGQPYEAAQALFDMAAFPGVHLKLTNRTLAAAAAGASKPAEFLERLVGAYGADRIAWGANFPATEGALPELLATAREVLSVLPVPDQELIFGGTAEKFYPTRRSRACCWCCC